MADKKIEKNLNMNADDCPRFYHDAYEYIPRIDKKDFLLNDKYTIFDKWWDSDESEDEE